MYQKLTTWEEICKVHNYNPTSLPIVDHLPKKFQEWIINTYKMGIITEAVNTDETGKIWTPDWNNDDQNKYQPWFEIDANEDKSSGVGFSDSGYGDWFTGSTVGSRLCFETYDKVKHVQKHFESVFLKMHLIEE